MLDKRSFDVLHYAINDKVFTSDDIASIVGSQFENEITDFLVDNHFIKCVEDYTFACDYQITRAGHEAHDEHKHVTTTRRIAIYGAITGTIALLIEVGMLFL